MTTFKEWILTEQPLGGDPGGGGMGGAPSAPPGGSPLGGSMPPLGGGGAPPPLGGDPLGGGLGGGPAAPPTPQTPQKLKTYDVWTTLEELLGISSSKKSKDKLQSHPQITQTKPGFQGLMS